MFWVILLLTGVISYVVLLKLPQRVKLLNRLAPFVGPPSLPVLGNALDLNVPKAEVLLVLERWTRNFGGRFKIFLGPQPYVVVTNASDAEKILSSQVLIEKSSDYDVLHPWLGLGLLTSRGDKWFHRRKQLTPAFHFKILDDFLRVFNEQCAVFRSVLESKGNKPFDVFPIITHCALDIICEAAMGRRIFAQQKSDSEYVQAVYRLSELVQYRQLRPWFHPDPIWRLSGPGREESRSLTVLHGFTDAVIAERKRERLARAKVNVPQDEFSGKKRQAFLDLLLEAQETDPTLTDKNIREETDTFMFEGHDTTSAAASWTTFLLSLHPEIQSKVQHELDSIFGDDRTRDCTTADLSKMKYLECCVKESLRLFPSVPFLARHVTKDLTLQDGSVVPASCTAFVLIYFLHRDASVFPDPERFDPDRFSPDNVQGRHAFAYVPFSAGPRNCIGQKFALMEEKVIVSTLFRNFNVTAAQTRDNVKVLCELITRPENGLRVVLKKR